MDALAEFSGSGDDPKNMIRTICHRRSIKMSQNRNMTTERQDKISPASIHGGEPKF